uniref:Ig-like domain-containing protein n=1 Tax=Poecilia reticulata TaxID=8081 RepID=A0A3P9PHW4_POERE
MKKSCHLCAELLGGELHLYHRAGENVVLPCNSSSFSSSCSDVTWFYNRNKSPNTQQKVWNRSPQAYRLNMDRSCSLIINDIDPGDSGLYTCRSGSGSSSDGFVYLNVLSVSSSPPDADPTKNGDITLLCSLVRFSGFSSCPDKSLLWLNETGSELTGEGDGYKSGGQFGCVSNLTVNLQSSRRFTCQFVERNKVKVEAHYQHEGMMSSHLSLQPYFILRKLNCWNVTYV